MIFFEFAQSLLGILPSPLQITRQKQQRAIAEKEKKLREETSFAARVHGS